MPQLNPSPWLAILIISWMIFLSVVPKKVLSRIFPNDPASQRALHSKTDPWSWPWH
nr:ATP synthase F0 subunit 8 [Sparisoma chrysopterum]